VDGSQNLDMSQTQSVKANATGLIRLKSREAADYLGIPEGTLRYWRSMGDRGPRSYALSPKHVVYDLSDLQEWADTRKAKTQRGGQ